MRKTLYASLLGTALLLGACAEQEAERPMLSDRPIAFSASIADDWNQTRSGSTISAATQTVTSDFRQPLYVHAVTTAGFEGDGTTTRGTKVTSLSEFSVSGYCYDAAGSQTVSDVQANFLNDDQITQGEGGLWLSSQPFYWPLAGYALDFYAYSPTTAATAVQDTQGPLKLTYSVNTADIEAQTDLLTAKATGETFAKNATVGLEFHHALTAVQFVIGDNTVPGTLKSVKFEEVYTSGTLNTGTDQWTLSAAPDYAISFTDHSTSDEDLLTGTKTLLMIPQTFTGENQRIVVVVNDGVQDYTLAWNLKDSRWEANTTVTYRISTSELNVMQMGTVTFPTTWGTGDNTVTYPFKSAYEENDAIGVFAVDGAGKVINANVKYKYDGTAWVKDDTQTTFYPATYTFYAYYPYQADGLSGAPAVGTNVLTEGALPTVSQFFSAARTAWAPAATQNTDALINAQDLQYAQGTITDGTNVNFTMAHACGLLAITLGTKEVPNIRYFNANTSNKVWDTEDDLVEVTTSSTFEGNLPLELNGTYYYIASSSATIQGAATDLYGCKETTIELEPGEYKPVVAECKRDYIYRGWEYGYTGGSQTWRVPCAGTYIVECWGAQGGNGWAYLEDETPVDPDYGKGGYTYGELAIESIDEGGTYFYVFVGGNGRDHSGYNGGGYGVSSNSGTNNGGGATDIRNISTQNGWSDASSLRSRVMVAGGGGGASHGGNGGPGGNLTGGNGVPSSNERLAYGYGGSQTSGGAAGTFSWSGTGPAAGSFGAGGRGNSHYGGGGGGGFYGGGGSGVYQSSCGGAGGGSSFISGYSGCRALASASSNSPKDANASDAAIHYSGVVFLHPRMEQGVRKGDGLARITSTVIE